MTMTPQPESTISEIVHSNAHSYFESALLGIASARREVLLESYIFSKGILADRFVEALSKAAQRGVSVRIIIDGAGVDSAFIDYAKSMRASGIKVRIYHPLPWHLNLWPMAITLSKGVEKFFYLITSVNRRNHRKLVIVDRSHVWLGSFNISDKHLPISEGGENWRDTAIELKHADISPLVHAFNRVWYRWRAYLAPKKVRRPTFPYLLNYTRYYRKANKNALLNRLAKAQDRIWITNAYFVPDAKLIVQLENASQRGVEVRVLIPKESDVPFIPWISTYFYDRLLRNGVRIFEYSPSMLHAKTLIIDDWATIGSSNFNRRSLFRDLEVDYIVQNPSSLQQLDKSFIQDSAQANEQQLDKLDRHPFWKRMIGGLLLVLMGYWI